MRADGLMPEVFWYAALFALFALLLVLFVREVPLKTASGLQQHTEAPGDTGTPISVSPLPSLPTRPSGS